MTTESSPESEAYSIEFPNSSESVHLAESEEMAERTGNSSPLSAAGSMTDDPPDDATHRSQASQTLLQSTSYDILSQQLSQTRETLLTFQKQHQTTLNSLRQHSNISKKESEEKKVLQRQVHFFKQLAMEYERQVNGALENDLSELRMQLGNVRANLKVSTDELQQEREKNESLQKQIDELKLTMESQSQELKMTQEREESLIKEKDDLTQQLIEFDPRKFHALQKEVDELKLANWSLRTKLKSTLKNMEHKTLNEAKRLWGKMKLGKSLSHGFIDTSLAMLRKKELSSAAGKTTHVENASGRDSDSEDQFLAPDTIRKVFQKRRSSLPADMQLKGMNPSKQKSSESKKKRRKKRERTENATSAKQKSILRRKLSSKSQKSLSSLSPVPNMKKERVYEDDSSTEYESSSTSSVADTTSMQKVSSGEDSDSSSSSSSRRTKKRRKKSRSRKKVPLTKSGDTSLSSTSNLNKPLRRKRSHPRSSTVFSNSDRGNKSPSVGHKKTDGRRNKLQKSASYKHPSSDQTKEERRRRKQKLHPSASFNDIGREYVEERKKLPKSPVPPQQQHQLPTDEKLPVRHHNKLKRASSQKISSKRSPKIPSPEPPRNVQQSHRRHRRQSSVISDELKGEEKQSRKFATHLHSSMDLQEHILHVDEEAPKGQTVVQQQESPPPPKSHFPEYAPNANVTYMFRDESKEKKKQRVHPSRRSSNQHNTQFSPNSNGKQKMRGNVSPAPKPQHPSSGTRLTDLENGQVNSRQFQSPPTFNDKSPSLEQPRAAPVDRKRSPKMNLVNPSHKRDPRSLYRGAMHGELAERGRLSSGFHSMEHMDQDSASTVASVVPGMTNSRRVAESQRHAGASTDQKGRKVIRRNDPYGVIDDTIRTSADPTIVHHTYGSRTAHEFRKSKPLRLKERVPADSQKTEHYSQQQNQERTGFGEIPQLSVTHGEHSARNVDKRSPAPMPSFQHDSTSGTFSTPNEEWFDHPGSLSSQSFQKRSSTGGVPNRPQYFSSERYNDVEEEIDEEIAAPLSDVLQTTYQGGGASHHAAPHEFQSRGAIDEGDQFAMPRKRFSEQIEEDIRPQPARSLDDVQLMIAGGSDRRNSHHTTSSLRHKFKRPNLGPLVTMSRDAKPSMDSSHNLKIDSRKVKTPLSPPSAPVPSKGLSKSTIERLHAAGKAKDTTPQTQGPKPKILQPFNDMKLSKSYGASSMASVNYST